MRIVRSTAFVALNFWPLSFDFGRQTGLLLKPSLEAGNVLFTTVVVLIVAVAASLWPAVKASKMEPVEALRHV